MLLLFSSLACFASPHLGGCHQVIKKAAKTAVSAKVSEAAASTLTDNCDELTFKKLCIKNIKFPVRDYMHLGIHMILHYDPDYCVFALWPKIKSAAHALTIVIGQVHLYFWQLFSHFFHLIFFFFFYFPSITLLTIMFFSQF